MPDELKHKLINQPNSKKQTMLHQLLESSSDTEQEIAEIKKLLDYGANPNAQDAAGQTPLHLIAKHGQANATILFERSSLHVREATGKTPCI
jgi:ankyrin repeat protein